MNYNPGSSSTKNPRHIEHIRYIVDYIPQIHNILEQPVRIQSLQFLKYQSHNVGYDR